MLGAAKPDDKRTGLREYRMVHIWDGKVRLEKASRIIKEKYLISNSPPIFRCELFYVVKTLFVFQTIYSI
jgi:hypothetical protein